LATAECQDMIVPQSLPMLKRFVASMSNSRRDTSKDGPSATDIQIQGCLRRFLSIYLNAQKREAPQSLACVKNCLLATTILFTGGKNHLPATEPLVARYLEELLDCLTDRMVCVTVMYSSNRLLTWKFRLPRSRQTVSEPCYYNRHRRLPISASPVTCSLAS
jgi:hypothetical protein